MGKKRSARRKTTRVRRLPAKVEEGQSDPPPPAAMSRPEWLPEDWQMEVKMRKDGIRVDRYYICPISAKMFRSKPEVMRYLGLDSGMVEESNCHASNVPDCGEQMASHGSEYSKNLVAALEDNPLEWLPTGWILEIGTCMNGSRTNYYKCYFNPPTGLRFYSKEEVLQYLEAHKLSTSNMGGSAYANAMDSCSSTQKEKTHMECPHNVLAEIDCSPSGLPRGWFKELRITRTRSSRQTRRDSYYIDTASGYVFPSKRDVFLYLENEEACRFAFRLEKSHLPKVYSLKKEALHPIAAIRKNMKKTALRRHIFSRQISKCNVRTVGEISDHPENPSLLPVANPSLLPVDHAEKGDDISETSFSTSEDFAHLGKENDKLETQNQSQKYHPVPENFDHLQRENVKLETESQSITAFHVEVAPGHSTIIMQSEAASYKPSEPVTLLEGKNTLVRDVTPSEWQFKLKKKQRQPRKPRRDCWLGSSNFKDIIKLDVNEHSLRKRKAAKPITIPLRASKRLAGVEADHVTDLGTVDGFHRAKAMQSVKPKPTLVNNSDPNSGPDWQCESDLKHKAILDGKEAEVEKGTKEQQVDPHTKARQVDKHQSTPAECSDPSRGSCDKGASDSDHQVILDSKKPQVEQATKEQVILDSKEPQVEQATKEQQIDPQMELPCGGSWQDPCLEFAFKTLTGDLPASIQDYFPRHVSTQSSVPSAQPAKLSSDKTSIKDDGRP